MFVGLWAKKDFAPVGAKPSFRTCGAGGAGGNPDPTNISLLTEQRQVTAPLTWRLWGYAPAREGEFPNT